MERKNYKYSMKNIPVASEKAYLKRLTEQTEHLIRRMRLKVMYYNRDPAEEDDTETEFNSYGFKSTRAPPATECLAAFEQDMYGLIRGV